ncbi:MAG: hypothetical protein OXP28_11320 [Gammaproteobacteria bacterium]|nr:hypothetical protein [Gammaproteobacteria bacterium]MDE0225716.1 hypothetical protein [Gammaproteobacteria bacterium]MDE0452237.1 hypothetical protein [Gammaproteobacteria bacterium]
MDKDIEVTNNAALALLISLASALYEQGDSAARRKLLRHLDARIDVMVNHQHPVWSSLWEPVDEDLQSLRNMRRWLHHQLEDPTIPHL